MSYPGGMRVSSAILLHPFESYPVTGDRHISSDLDRSRFEFAHLEDQSLARLVGDPLRNVILVNRGGANRWPAKEFLVPQT